MHSRCRKKCTLFQIDVYDADIYVIYCTRAESLIGEEVEMRPLNEAQSSEAEQICWLIGHVLSS